MTDFFGVPEFGSCDPVSVAGKYPRWNYEIWISFFLDLL